MGASWGFLGSWVLGASQGLLGAAGSKCPFGSPVWAPSWSRLGRLLGRLGGPLGRLGALFGHFVPTWRFLGSWAVLGLGSWVLGRRARTPKSYNNHMKMNERGGGVLTSHCITVYMCTRASQTSLYILHMRAACPIVMIFVVCGLDPKYNYQLHQILLNPQSGGHHYVMYWIPLPRCQRHHHNPVNETFGLAIFVSTALGRLGIGRIGQFLTLRVSPPASVASGSSSARQRADASGGSPAGASPAGGHRRGLCLVPDA